MKQPLIARYGSWKSPISLDMVAHGSVKLLRIVLDGTDTCWAEVRPAEQGRTVIVRRTLDGDWQDITPPGFSVGSMVNEHGTRSFTVASGEVLFPIIRTSGFTGTAGETSQSPLLRRGSSD